MRKKLKNFNIGNQLRVSYGLLMIFVVLMGILGVYQTNKMYDNTKTMYNNPLQVRRAIAELSDSISTARISSRDILILQNESKEVIDQKYENVIRAFSESEIQINILYDKYLGPKEDLDLLLEAYKLWENSLLDRVDGLMLGSRAGSEEALYGILMNNDYRDSLLDQLNVIDRFASNKAIELYASSTDTNNLMNIYTLIIVIVIIIFSMLMSIIVYRNIKTPIDALNRVAKAVQKGDLTIRSNIKEKNEIGLFARLFDQMLESIEIKAILNEKSANLAGVMLSLDSAKEFFQLTLATLAEHVGAQNTAIYLLSDDKKTYDLFESIGMSSNMKQSFNVNDREGEFGKVLTLKKVISNKMMSEKTKFVFPTSSGDYLPAEMMTIPITTNNEIIAVITLSTLSEFSVHSIELIDDILLIMSARIEGILNFKNVIELKTVLEDTNYELEIQKSELKAQSAELNIQNRELEAQKEQLSEASQLKTNFLSNMSHELRTPLNAVIALSGILSRKLVGIISDEEYGYLDVIGRSGQNLLALINDILDISRIESGKIEIEVESFNLSQLIGEILELLHPISDQKNIELRFKDEKIDCFVTTDVEKSRHILQNIISNAVKFTEKGSVDINVTKDATGFQIIISDTGIGIDQDHLEHIFDEFRQADGTTTRKFGGTGLGLAIAKKYTEYLGGTIDVQSVKGEGTQFTVTLPILKLQTPEMFTPKKIRLDNIDLRKTTEKFVASESDSLKISYNVLIIEDSEPAIVQISEALTAIGCKITIAKEGRSGLDEIKKSIPDAIVLDLMMPGLDGFEFLEFLRGNKQTKEVPVLVLTAKHISYEEHGILRDYNVKQLIQKGSINFYDLQNALKSLLQDNSKEVEKKPSKNIVSQNRPVILVAEDNPENMITVRALLKDRFEVLEATDGESAVEMAGIYIPDLILMDIALPIMDGVEAFKLIRKNMELRNIPIIALTASAMVSDREIFLAHGFDAFIPKPIIEKKFFKVIEEVLYGS